MLLIKTNWDSSTEMGAKGTKGIIVYAEMYVPDEYSWNPMVKSYKTCVKLCVTLTMTKIKYL